MKIEKRRDDDGWTIHIPKGDAGTIRYIFPDGAKFKIINPFDMSTDNYETTDTFDEAVDHIKNMVNQ